MEKYEQDIKDLIAKMTAQQQGNISPNRNNEYMGGTDQSPHLQQQNQSSFNNGVDQSPINPVNSVRQMGDPISKQPKTSTIPSTDSLPPGACQQCGIIHPPLPPGAKCPMAPLKINTGQDEKVVDVNKYLNDLKNIVISQSESKKIKDYDKLFKNITIEIVKYLEGYKE